MCIHPLFKKQFLLKRIGVIFQFFIFSESAFFCSEVAIISFYPRILAETQPTVTKYPCLTINFYRIFFHFLVRLEIHYRYISFGCIQNGN